MSTEITPARRRELAEAIDCNEQYLYQCLKGLREMDAAKAMTAETVSGGELRRWFLCQKTWHIVWPDLIGTEGAPPVPTDDPKPAPKRGKSEHAEARAISTQREFDKITRSACARRDGPSSEREGRG